MPSWQRGSGPNAIIAQTVLVVDDKSNETTRIQLRQYTSNAPWMRLIEFNENVVAGVPKDIPMVAVALAPPPPVKVTKFAGGGEA